MKYLEGTGNRVQAINVSVTDPCRHLCAVVFQISLKPPSRKSPTSNAGQCRATRQAEFPLSYGLLMPSWQIDVPRIAMQQK
jgi:hypothetical protein